MTRKLDDIFSECYERIRLGESLESCLMSYPEHAAELEPLLRTALDIGRRASYIHPRPEFKHWALVRLEGAQHYAKQQKPPEKPGLFSWRQSWAVAITAILVLLLSGGSTMAASLTAFPDEPLYPVKLATEQVRLTFAISDENKAQVHTELAQTRAVEIQTMANEGKAEQVAITAERLANQLELANLAIEKMEITIPTSEPVPTPTPEPTPIPTPEPTPIPTPEPTPIPTPEPTPTPEPVPTPTPPEVTTTPPEITTTPPTADKGDKERDAKRERFKTVLKKSLETSTSRSLTALENAKEKASPQAKTDWQQAIDTVSKKSYGKPSHEHGSGAGESGQSDNKTWDGGKPNTVSPNQSQPSPSKWQKHW